MNLFTFPFIVIDCCRCGNEWMDVMLILSSEVNDGVDRIEPPDGIVVSRIWLFVVISDSSDTWEGNLWKEEELLWLIKYWRYTLWVVLNDN